MVAKGEVTEVFCIIDEFDKNLSLELLKVAFAFSSNNGIRHRKPNRCMSESEIMTILICCHFGTYRTLRQITLNMALC